MRLDYINIIAISTVFGNSSVDETTNNALKLMNILQVDPIQIFKGSSCPENKIYRPANISANDVFERFASERNATVQTGYPVKQLLDLQSLARSRKKNLIDLICLGPLTNVAQIIKNDRNNIRLTILGGSLSAGNLSKFSEFNFAMDSASAHAVLSSACEKTIITLDVCRLIPAERFFISSDKCEDRCVGVWNRLLELYLCRINDESANAPLYDPTAILYLLFPCAFKKKRLKVSVLISGDEQDGMLCLDRNGQYATIVTDVNLDKLTSLFTKMLT